MGICAIFTHVFHGTSLALGKSSSYRGTRDVILTTMDKISYTHFYTRKQNKVRTIYMYMPH